MHFPEHHRELRKHFPWIQFKKYYSQIKTLPKLGLCFYSKTQNTTFSGAALVLLSTACLTLIQTDPPKQCPASLLILVQVLAAPVIWLFSTFVLNVTIVSIIPCFLVKFQFQENNMNQKALENPVEHDTVLQK